MPLKSIGYTLGLAPVVVTGEAVGTGDGTETNFTLDYNTVREGTLVVYGDDTEITSGYTPNYADGEIDFDTAPANGVEITADYVAGPSTKLLEAGTDETVLVFGCQAANIDDTDDATVTLYRLKDGSVERYFTKDYNLPVHSPLKPLAGTIVLEDGDELHGYASAIDAVDVQLEYKV